MYICTIIKLTAPAFSLVNVYIFMNEGVALSSAGIWWGIQWVVKYNLLFEVVLPGISHAGP